MQVQRSRTRRRFIRGIGLAAVVLLTAVILWIDIATGLWQEAVVLSGIAAGLLTFLLTALFFERWIRTSDHRRWYPVTHLALTDLLHALGDDERSQFSRGIVVARSIGDTGEHAEILQSIHDERRAISHALARWAGFLAASADVQALMDRTATLALRLDAARDAVLDAERSPSNLDAQNIMRAAIGTANASIRGAMTEIEATLDAFAKQHA